jgi:HAD superfamily hydrolase (TIGR01459 family)
MKMIKPIVNISKIMDAYDIILCGFNGVIHDGVEFRPEAIDALIRLRKNGKKIVLVSNTSLRILKMAEMMYAAKISPYIFTAIVTAGEILHYKLQAADSIYSALGKVYYNLGHHDDTGVFEGLGYTDIENLSRADFMYIGLTSSPVGVIEYYMDVLGHAASLNIPMLCVGNDTSAFVNGEIGLASGAIAEQYAVLGGRIITLGKPDPKIIDYALEACGNFDKNRVLLIGDSILTDIKAASSVGISSVLISKGIHINFLGEGYIPDVTKTRELATNFDAFPDYVVSNLRW